MDNNNFHIGQIIEGAHHPEVAKFCNDSQGTDNPCYLKEIEPLNGIRRFQIMPDEQPTEQDIIKEQNERRERELESYLASTDWYAVRYSETGVEIPQEIKTQRQSAREEISRLREELKNN